MEFGVQDVYQGSTSMKLEKGGRGSEQKSVRDSGPT